MRQMWQDRESDIKRKVTNSAPDKDTDLRRATEAVATLPATRLPPSTFLQALGTPLLCHADRIPCIASQ